MNESPSDVNNSQNTIVCINKIVKTHSTGLVNLCIPLSSIKQATLTQVVGNYPLSCSVNLVRLSPTWFVSCYCDP